MADKNRQIKRLIRYLSRMMLKFFGRAASGAISNFLLKSFNNSIIKYFYFFLSSHILEDEYVYFLRKNDFISAIETKNKWAKLILKFSTEKHEKIVAKHYLWILSKYSYADNVLSNDSIEDELKNIRKNSDKKFYLYGPNSRTLPNVEYKDYTLVVTKDIDKNTHEFNDSILFLNHIYYRTKVANNKDFKDKLLNKYGKIYISSMNPIADKEFEHSKMLPASGLCGTMALGRVLYNLILQNGRFDCVIEVYDQYLSANAYSKYYPTLMR